VVLKCEVEVKMTDVPFQQADPFFSLISIAWMMPVSRYARAACRPSVLLLRLDGVLLDPRAVLDVPMRFLYVSKAFEAYRQRCVFF
jgi:hypothetical protein